MDTTLFVSDLAHFLDDKGAVGPAHGPARKMADLLCAFVAHATNPETSAATVAPYSFGCCLRDRCCVATGMDAGEISVWHCPSCAAAGQITNWQHSLWDLRDAASAC